VPEPARPSSPIGAQGPASAGGAPPSSTRADSSHDAMGSSPRLEPTEFPELPPPDSQSFRLGPTSGLRPGEGSSMPQFEKQPWQHSHVAESLWDNPKFI
jgi:hypothetical protein